MCLHQIMKPNLYIYLDYGIYWCIKVNVQVWFHYLMKTHAKDFIILISTFSCDPTLIISCFEECIVTERAAFHHNTLSGIQYMSYGVYVGFVFLLENFKTKSVSTSFNRTYWISRKVHFVVGLVNRKH